MNDQLAPPCITDAPDTIFVCLGDATVVRIGRIAILYLNTVYIVPEEDTKHGLSVVG